MSTDRIGRLEERFRQIEPRLTSDVAKEIQDALNRASKEPKEAIVCIRRALEALLPRVYRQFMGEEPRYSMLGQILSTKAFKKRLEPRSLHRLHFVRTMANTGAHEVPPRNWSEATLKSRVD